MKDPAYQRERRRLATAANSVHRAARPPPTRTSKRFLASMIRNVDAHNQRQATEEARREARRPSRRPRSRWDMEPDDVRRSLHEADTHRSARRASRSVSPPLRERPPMKVRQWDLGKETGS